MVVNLDANVRREAVAEEARRQPTESFLCPRSEFSLPLLEMKRRFWLLHLPTLELASVNEFNMVDLPLEGFPTSPISGSRGILAQA